MISVLLKGKSIHIRPLTDEDAEDLLNLQINNKEFFEAFSMQRKSNYYTLEEQRKLIERKRKQWVNDEEYYFGIFLNEENTLIGTINLFQVYRDSLQSAFIGYFLDKTNNGKGYATEAVGLIVHYAFQELKLHRIEAGVMPHNIPSIRILEKNGFHKEGIARKNVLINGKWEDHQVLAIINPNDE